MSCLVAEVVLMVQPVLVLESEEAVAEIMQLKTMPIAGTVAAGCQYSVTACCQRRMYWCMPCMVLVYAAVTIDC